MTLWPLFSAVLLVAASNLGPWAAGVLCGRRCAAPLDFGATLQDGSRLFGSHKTWRGLVVGTFSCSLVAIALGYTASLGAAFGALSLTADAGSSFVKRRLHRPPGTDTPGLDSLPEALLPLLLLRDSLRISIAEAFYAALAFGVLHASWTYLRHRSKRTNRTGTGVCRTTNSASLPITTRRRPRRP